MAKVRARKETGRLYIDFFFRGQRCREQTTLADTPTNWKRLEKLLDRIEAEIQAGTFDYQRYFPYSKRATKFAPEKGGSTEVTPVAAAVAQAFPATNQTPPPPATPTFSEFAKTWYSESEVSWRKSHQRTIRDILDKRLIPEFGEKVVGQITKADIMAFRSTLAKVPGRKSSTLKAKSINAIMTPLRQILNEAADRFEFNTPFRNIKPLKVQKSDVEPFTLDEVQQILENVRADFRNYYTVRFFTGMRTGEIDGLKWKYVDFAKRMILVRESIVAGEQDYTKTDGSQREIQMSGLVYEALQVQAKVAAAFLHDAGKADDFRLTPDREGYEFSERGRLVGYRHTILEWLAVARCKDGVIVPESQYLALVHALTATRGAEHLGIRGPQIIEATILSVADRVMAEAAWGYGCHGDFLQGASFDARP